MPHALPALPLLLAGVAAVARARWIARTTLLRVLTALVGLAALAGGLGLLAGTLHL